MYNNKANVPEAKNEPVLSYAPGTNEKKLLKAKLEELSKTQIEIPMVIGGKEVCSGNFGKCVQPHNHKHILGKFHKGNAEYVSMAISAAMEAKKDWEALSWNERAAIFLRAAEMLAGEYRYTLNAATMLGQSKTAHQAEIDSACELIDFLRFNVQYMSEIYAEQPISTSGIWNQVDYRPLEGFVFAVTPFNFTAIAGNLPTSAAMLGNTVVWKPASTAVYSAHFFMQILKKAGLPDGVINIVPGSGSEIGDPVLDNANLAGIHFTGSTEVFQSMWRTVGENIQKYKTYPRIVGETGGKDFVFVHSSAEVKEVVANTIRGAFEYQGQKCSAASRAYIPESLWEPIKKEMLEQIALIKVGDVSDFTNFMGAVIDESAFNRMTANIDLTKSSTSAKIICGGKCDSSKGYFVEPTIIKTEDPYFKTMKEELFGPVLTIFVYPDNKFAETLKVCNETSAYALTGAIFAKDRYALVQAATALRHAAGNLYINDKPTGAVIGQQPFGGARASGTNDKAGSKLNLLRWISARTIKEVLEPVSNYKYPFLSEK